MKKLLYSLMLFCCFNSYAAHRNIKKVIIKIRRETSERLSPVHQVVPPFSLESTINMSFQDRQEKNHEIKQVPDDELSEILDDIHLLFEPNEYDKQRSLAASFEGEVAKSQQSASTFNPSRRILSLRDIAIQSSGDLPPVSLQRLHVGSWNTKTPLPNIGQ